MLEDIVKCINKYIHECRRYILIEESRATAKVYNYL